MCITKPADLLEVAVVKIQKLLFWVRNCKNSPHQAFSCMFQSARTISGL